MKELLEFNDVFHKIKRWKSENVKYIFFLLLLEKKVSFKELSESYVEALEVDNTDKLKQLIEAETCVLENIVCSNKPKNQTHKNAIQRSLYLLNKSNRFQMEKLNKKFGYDEKEAKKLSWYERDKNNNEL
jgi:hypothetical protein